MKYSLSSVCDVVVRWCLYAALAATPIFFLPVSLYAVSLNKQALLTTLIFIAAIAWLIKTVNQGEILLVKTPLHGAVFALVVVTSISAFFSRARAIGFMGVNGSEVDTVLAIISFALFYFLLASSFTSESELRRAVFISFASGIAVFSLFVFQAMSASGYLGFITDAYKWLLPWDFAQSAGFNTVGTTNALGLYFGLLFTLLFSYVYFCRSWRPGMRAFMGVVAALFFIVTILIGYWLLFACLMAALLVIVGIDLRVHGVQASRRLAVPLGIAIISLFIVMAGRGVISFSFPRVAAPDEIAPSFSASWQVAKSTTYEGFTRFSFGSGPAMYQYQYGKYRDALLNQSPFWNINFAQGANAFMTHAVSWGFAGTALFILFLFFFLRDAARVFAANRISLWLASSLLAASVYIVLALGVYPHNFVFYSMLFACAGLIAAARGIDKKGLRVISFTSSPRATFAWSLIMIVLVIGCASFIYINGARYGGAFYFARGVTAANIPGGNERAVPLFAIALNADPRNDIYLQVMANSLLVRANTLMAAATSTVTDVQKTQFLNIINAAVSAAERSTEVNPDNAVNWIGLARVHETVAPFITGSWERAFTAYAEAEKREPNNPAIAVQEGVAREAHKENQAAQSAFEKSLSLKSDYAPAHFALMQLFDRIGKSDEAVAQADRLRALAPRDVTVLFQLGVVHYQADRLGKAREVFEAAVQQSPDYANALYFLGLVYEKQGDHPLALAKFERVLALNPDNKDVIAALNRIRSVKETVVPAKKKK